MNGRSDICDCRVAFATEKQSITLQLLISDLYCCHHHCHCCLLNWSGPILQSELMCWSRITKPSSRNSIVLTLLYTEGVIMTPLPTLKFSSNRKVWFSPSYKLGHMGINYDQDKENASKLQQYFRYASCDKMINDLTRNWNEYCIFKMEWIIQFSYKQTKCVFLSHFCNNYKISFTKVFMTYGEVFPLEEICWNFNSYTKPKKLI